MGKRTRYAVLALIVGLTGYACKKVITVDLKDAASQLVIEGQITNFAHTGKVTISRSVPFSSNKGYPPVSGAQVSITDSTSGVSALLNETDSGVYTTKQIDGTPLHTYLLRVTVEGKTYTASSTMPLEVPLDSVTFAVNIDFNNHKDINAVINFQDPAGLGNYYQFTESVNDRPIPNIFVFEDRLSDGRYIEQPLFNDSAYLQKFDELELTMNCIDQRVYTYFLTLANVTANNTFQSATPTNPNTNINGGALGYFSAHTSFTTRVQVY
jgi:hypothetical protein